MRYIFLIAFTALSLSGCVVLAPHSYHVAPEISGTIIDNTTPSANVEARLYVYNRLNQSVTTSSLNEFKFDAIKNFELFAILGADRFPNETRLMIVFNGKEYLGFSTIVTSGAIDLVCDITNIENSEPDKDICESVTKAVPRNGKK